MSFLSALLGVNLWLVALVVPMWLAYGSGASPCPPWMIATLPLAPIVLLLALRRPRHALAAPALLCGVPILSLLSLAAQGSAPAPDPSGPHGIGNTLADAALPHQAVVVQAAVLLAYLIVTCRDLTRPLATDPMIGPKNATPASSMTIQPVPHIQGAVPLRWRRRVMLYRALFGLSLALPALLLYAIHLHPAHLRAFELSFAHNGDLSRVAAVQATATAAAALLWVTLYRMCFLGPLHGHLLHDRAVNQSIAELRQAARRGRPRTQFYLAMLLALGSMVLLIWRSLRRS